MKKKALAAIAAVVLFNTGCTPVLKELRYPGGYPGYLLDKRTFNASGSKQLLLLRATLILAMAAEMSRVTVKGDDGDAFAKHLAAATAEINYAAADLYPALDDNGVLGKVCGLNITSDPAANVKAITDDDEGCTGFYSNFEGDVPLLEARIIKVMLAALPTDRARKFLDDAANGNVMGAAWHAVSTVAASAGGLHFAFARYRSGEELVAGSMGAGCVDPGIRGGFSARHMTVIEATKCLGLSQTDLFKNPGEAKATQLNGEIKPGAFFVLMRSVASACVDLPYTGDVAAITSSRASRRASCNAIGFKPKSRPYRVNEEKTEAPLAASAPGPVAAPTAAPPTATVPTQPAGPGPS